MKGSIPAGAGEPIIGSWSGNSLWVYPRGCGGTLACDMNRATPVGLSPRVRGNPTVMSDHRINGGSIPAGAGEPLPTCTRTTTAKVYPRGCGGTTSSLASRASLSGLSPRVRGNPMKAISSSDRGWSIPAGAGEPDMAPARTRGHKVYPRGCGGTHREFPDTLPTMGLSPRVRGNQPEMSGRRSLQRSIPAGAGEPRRA